MKNIDLVLGKIPEKDFKKITNTVKSLVVSELKKKLVGKFGIIFGTPLYFLSRLMVSFFYYSYLLPKRQIAKNRAKARKYRHRLDKKMENFEKSQSINDVINSWKEAHRG